MVKPRTKALPGDPATERMPSRQDVLRFIAQSPDEVTKRDLVRAFGLKGYDRTMLKRMLRELEAEGALARGRRRRMRAAGRLPGVAVLEVSGTDAEGELLARPVRREEDDEEAEGEPRIHLAVAPRAPAPGIGERVLARLTRVGEGAYEASVIRVLPGQPRQVVGVIESAGGGSLRVVPIGARGGQELRLDAKDAAGAVAGEVVAAERVERGGLGLASARVVERLGQPGDPRAISLMTAHLYDLPVAFPPEAVAQAEAAGPVAPGKRVDLRDLPLVTIDGPDARDFDDAVHAAPDDDPKNPGGFRVTVAIADVAHYVRPGDPLDREARRRGNSVYFPDRVVPMLPHALSSGLCSLKPGEERACLAVEMQIDRKGKLTGHRFARGLMRSAARLTYEQVQAAHDGAPDDLTGPLLEAVITPLYAAFQALLAARRARGTLDLDLPEIGVRIGEDGRPAAVGARPRLDSHRLIEEMMIAANVAAAETLERVRMPCMYRVHDRPDPVKMEALAELLESLGLPHGRGTLGKPKDLARLLGRVHGSELAPLVSSFVLRAQSQAVYSPHNIGHFGLNLGRYAHFTSPIRRYSDLLVHRALIRGLKLGEGGLEDDVSSDAFAEAGGWISRTERRAMEAERAALNRFVALHMEARIGETFTGTVVSVQRFGLFVQLDGIGADGLIPVGDLGGWWTHDPAHHALLGERAGEAMGLGDRVKVELRAADSLTGQITFRLLDHTPGPAAAAALRAGRRRPRAPQRHLRPQRRRR
jgi:ribonuclease R